MPWPVPARWDAANATSGVSRVEVWSRDTQVADISGPAGDLGSGIIGGVVTEKRVTGIRSSLSLSVEPSAQWVRWCRLPAMEIRVFSGLSWGTSEFLVPLGRFPVLPPSIAVPSSVIQIDADDYWSRLVSNKFLRPEQSTTDRSIKDSAANLIARATGRASVVSASSGAWTPAQLWDKDKTFHDIVSDLMSVIGGEAFIDREGVPRVQDRIASPGLPLTDGETGTVMGARTTEDWGGVFNEIVVMPNNNDVPFFSAVAVISDPNHPAHFSNIGHRGTSFTSPLFTTYEQGEAAAPVLLSRMAEAALSWTVTAIPDPSRTAGDGFQFVTDLGAVNAVISEVKHDITGAPMTLTLGAAA